MNDQPHVPHVRNNIPLIPYVMEGVPFPPHRIVHSNSHIVGMSHSDLLAEEAKILNGHKVHGAWAREIFNELIYRGLISIRNLNGNLSLVWTYEKMEKVYGIPLTKERWNEIVTLKDGYQLPEV